VTTQTVEAVYKNGKLQFKKPIVLAEGEAVRVTITPLDEEDPLPTSSASLAAAARMGRPTMISTFTEIRIHDLRGARNTTISRISPSSISRRWSSCKTSASRTSLRAMRISKK
jgi:predicted DNA-binding antitoxin AbrB/MazE fold protein